MRVYDIEKIPPGNPFDDEPNAMGMYVGTNVSIMYDNFPGSKCTKLIVIDTTTGERKQINFD